ncbi:MAG: DUF1329 domain-containing protein [Alphaproteobacteria bacterium]|nr:DUF1329 domain-containing protein [Alphaproteobacteria bacterium]
MKIVHIACIAIAVGLASGDALARVPKDQVDRLDKDLTPFGSERAGSGDVPAWTGGLARPPAGVKFDPKKQNEPDPYAGDKIRFTITAANAAQYADRLMPGHKALLKLYDTYQMNVYPSHRSCALPEFVYAANKQNAAVGELTSDGDGVTGAAMGAPFPIPSNAMELMWDAKLKYRGFKVARQYAVAPVQHGGSYSLITVQDRAIVRWSDPSVKRAEDLKNIALYYVVNALAPPRLAGNIVLMHESLNAAVEPRKAWAYSPGTRRVRRAPDIAYDNVGTNTEAMSTADAIDGFNGAMDRYNWGVQGRSVMFIPYNNYAAVNVKYADLLGPNHLNQKLMRYEAHRVWNVEAKLKPGQRHIYARRVFHIDEDSHGIAGVEIYDGRGTLWRFQELQNTIAYHVPVCAIGAELVYDLIGKRYLASGLRNEEPPIDFFANYLTEGDFTPESMRTLGIR